MTNDKLYLQSDLAFFAAGSFADDGTEPLARSPPHSDQNI